MRGKSILMFIILFLISWSAGVFIVNDYSMGNTINSFHQEVEQRRIPVRQIKYRSRVEMRRFVQKQQAFPATYLSVNGVAAGRSDTISKEVRAVAIADPKGGNSKVVVGFKSMTLRNTGSSSWPGVTVRVHASPYRIKTDDSIDILVTVFRDGTAMEATTKTREVKTGSSFSVVSEPFEMEPNVDYHAIGCFVLSCSGMEIEAVVGHINDIQWNI